MGPRLGARAGLGAGLGRLRRLPQLDVGDDHSAAGHDDPKCERRYAIVRCQRRRGDLVRIDDDWYAVGDRCTHLDISLSEGEVHLESREIECWKHGSCFSLVTGEPSSLPATKAVPVYDVRLDGDDVYLVVP